MVHELMPHELAASARLASLTLPAGWRREAQPCADQLLTILHPDQSTAPLAIALEQSGRCRILLGVWAPAHRAPAALQVRLSTMQAWRQLRPVRLLEDRHHAVQQAELGVFDLPRGATLECRGVPGSQGGLVYVRCEPAGSTSATPACPDAAGVVMDTAMALSSFRIDEPTDLHAILQPFVGTSIRHIFWGTAVGSYRPLYRSRVLGWHGSENEASVGAHRAAAAHAMRRLVARDTDPLHSARAYCREHGLTFWLNDRINKNHEHDYRDDYPGGRYLLKNAAQRVRTIDGALHPQATLSFASAEVRAMKVQLLVEQAGCDPDGIFLDFLRMPSIVGWEQPVLDAFQARTGMAPQHAPRDEWFKPWIEHIGQYVTAFLRELRQALTPLEQARGRRYPIMAQVPGGWRFNDAMPEAQALGLDVAQWARDELVQYVAPAEWTALMWEVQAFDRWAQLLAGTPCQLWGAMGSQFREGCASHGERAEHQTQPADLDPWRFMRAANEYFQQSAAGVYIWEAHDLSAALPCWDIVQWMGCPDAAQSCSIPPIGPFDARRRVKQVVIP